MEIAFDAPPLHDAARLRENWFLVAFILPIIAGILEVAARRAS
jgi:hypothetical protein